MTVIRRFLCILFPVLGLCAAGPAARCQAQVGNEPRQPPFRESVSFETDSAVVRKLLTAQDYAATGKWEQAVEVLHETLAEHGGTLIAVETGRYLNVADYCHLILAGLPGEALVLYRRRVDAQARGWLETGLRERDEDQLRQLVRRAFASSYGDEALMILGQWAWEEGRISEARAWWRQLLPPEGPSQADDAAGLAADLVPKLSLGTRLSYPDADAPASLVAARLVLCSIVEGDLERARHELAVFRKRYGSVRGRLAGIEGELAGILESVLKEAADWPSARRPEATSTFAGNARRDESYSEAIEVGGVQWSVELPEDAYRHLVPRLSLETRPALPDPGPLSTFPVVYGDVVLACDAQRIYAWDLFSRHDPRPAWGAEEAVIYSLPTGGRLPSPIRRVVGVPRYTLTVHGGRLFARMGAPIAGRAIDEHPGLSGEIVCLDLAGGQGRFLWRVRPEANAERWSFEGTPVAAADRVYAALRSGGTETKLNVACYDAETGRELWNRRVCAAVPLVGDDQNLISHHLLTVGGGSLFFSTHLGAIAALDARDGRLKWLATYESRRPRKVTEWNDPRRHMLTPCLYHRGVVAAAPADSEKLFVLDAGTGRRLFEPISLPGGVRHLLGVSQGKLFVSGDHLWRIDLASGKVDGRFRRDDPADHGYGRGLLAGGLVYFPTREHLYLLRPGERRGRESFSAKTVNSLETTPGKRVPTPLGIERRVDLRALFGTTGGNLAVAEGHLLIAQPRRVVVYSEYSQPRRRLKEAISANPHSAASHFRLARLEEAAERIEAAIKHYGEAARQSGSGEHVDGRPLQKAAAGRLFRLLREAARAAEAAGRLEAAAERLNEASRAAPDAQARLTTLVELARLHRARGDPRAAVGVWQRILDDPDSAKLSPAGSTTSAWLLARAGISRLIEAHGRDVYSAVERRAETAFREAVRDPLHRYPHAAAGARALMELASEHHQNRQWSQAMLAWKRAVKHPAVGRLRPTALIHLAIACEQRRFWRVAAEAWSRLAEEHPESGVDESGPEVSIPDRSVPDAASIRDAVPDGTQRMAADEAARLERPEYRRQRRIDAGPRLPLPLERAWSVSAPEKGRESFSGSRAERADGPGGKRLPTPLTEAVRVIVPEGRAPGWQAECVLLASTELVCLDRHDGTARWRRPLPMAPKVAGTLRVPSAMTANWNCSLRTAHGVCPLPWAGYVGTWLVLADAERLFAVDPTTGETVWETIPPWAGNPPGGRPPRGAMVRAVGERILLLHPEYGVIAVDGAIGSILWEFRIGENQPQSRPLPGSASICENFRAGPSRVILQMSRVGAAHRQRRTNWQSVPLQRGASQATLTLLVLDVETGQPAREVPCNAAPGFGGAVELAGGRLAFVDSARRVQSLAAWSRSRSRQTLASLSAGPNYGEFGYRTGDWRWNGPVSQANAEPELLSSGKHLLLVIDGEVLARLEPETGATLWRRPLGAWPVRRAREVVAIDEEFLYAPSAGILRCLSPDDGRLVWETYLGPPAWRWKAVIAGEYVAAFPVQADAGERLPLIVCEAATGRYVQKLWFRESGGGIEFHPGPVTGIVISGDRITGLRRLESDP